MQKRLDPVLFEILRHRVEEIVFEAYYTLARCSGNAVIAECGDHEEALLNADGDTVMVSGGIVEWDTVLEAAGKYLIEAYESNPGIREGDQFVFNDCYLAAVHHMDVQVLAPIFWEGKRIAWMVTAGHTMDVGGMTPGGFMTAAEDVFQEGLNLPGLKLVEGGIIRKDVENTIRSMVRMPDLFMLDISACIAANNTSTRRLQEMIREYGIDTILGLFQQMQEYSERLTRAKLNKIPNGKWQTVCYIESTRKEESYLSLKLTATKEGDELILDFTGSSPQSQGSQNMARPGTISNALDSFLTMFAYDIPWSAGVWRPVKFIIPEGTIVNPKFPAAVSTNTPGGAGALVIYAVQGIMAQMLLSSRELYKDAYASPGGGKSVSVLTGVDKAGGFFETALFEHVVAGMGASPYRDGEEACASAWTPKSQIANIEMSEQMFPFLYLFRKEAIDTAGAGKFRGGVGNVRAIIPWDTDSIRVNDISYGQKPRIGCGLAGGYPPPNSANIVIRNSNVLEKFKMGAVPSDITEIEGKRESILPMSTFKISPEDVYISYQTGGGGFGDPVDRQPELVANDVKVKYVSPETAEKLYGVVLELETLEVNSEKTERKRRTIVKKRLRLGESR